MNKTENPIKIAVVGAGLVGKRHVEYIKEEPLCELGGIVDINPHAEQLASEYHTDFYRDVDSFIKDNEADAVIISTPNNTHSEIGIKCINSGLHILVEKPIDADLKFASEMVNAAEKAGIKMQVGHSRRFNSYIEAAKKIVNSGELGRVTAVSALWALRKPPRYYDAVWRREDGGGPILINLIHDIDNLRYIFGDIEQVYAVSSNAVRKFTVEDTVVLTIRFKSGILGTAVISDTAASPYNFESATGENPLLHAAHQDCYRFFGTKATLNFPEMKIWYYIDERDGGWEDPILSKCIPVKEEIPIKKQLTSFCRVILEDSKPRCSGLDGLKTLEVIMAVKESVRTGRPVNL